MKSKKEKVEEQVGYSDPINKAYANAPTGEEVTAFLSEYGKRYGMPFSEADAAYIFRVKNYSGSSVEKRFDTLYDAFKWVKNDIDKKVAQGDLDVEELRLLTRMAEWIAAYEMDKAAYAENYLRAGSNLHPPKQVEEEIEK